MPLSRITSPFMSATANVYSPSANTIAIRTASADRVTVDSSGNIGSLTSSPARQFHLFNTGNAFERLETNNTGSVAQIEFKNTNAQTHFIGIETSAGNAGFNGSTAYALCLEASGARDICFATNSTNRAKITSAGLFSIVGSVSAGGYIVGGQYYRSSGMVNETVTVTTEAFVYSMNKDQGSGGSSATSTYNITGIPNADGSFAIIFMRNSNTAAGINCTTILQIHGNEVWRGGVQNTTKTASFMVFRENGTWRTTQWHTGAAFSNVW